MDKDLQRINSQAAAIRMKGKSNIDDIVEFNLVDYFLPELLKGETDVDLILDRAIYYDRPYVVSMVMEKYPNKDYSSFAEKASLKNNLYLKGLFNKE